MARKARKRMPKARKQKLTDAQEFEILKLVLDKFLWLGFGVMAFGLFKILSATFIDGVYYIVAGAVVLLLFMLVIVKEYEFMHR